MVSPEGSAVVSSPSLERVLAQALGHPDLREALRKLLQIGRFVSRLGWPFRLCSPGGQRHLFGARTLLLLSSERTGGHYGLVFHNDHAAGLVERLLGGSGRTTVPGGVGALSEAECGVLAYLSARCSAALGGDLRVLDVLQTNYAQLSAFGADAAVLPFVCTSPELQLELALVYWAPLPAIQQPLELVVPEHVDEPALRSCQPGDLLCSDTWPLYATATGLAALAELRCSAIVAPLQVTLESGHLQRRSGEAAAGNARLLLASLSASFTDLLALGSGEPWPLPQPPGNHCVLQGPTGESVSGTLVQYRGTVALRVR